MISTKELKSPTHPGTSVVLCNYDYKDGDTLDSHIFGYYFDESGSYFSFIRV